MNRKTAFLISLALPITLFLFAGPPAAARETKKREWCLEQREALAGVHRIYWTDDAIKIEADQGYTWMTKAPYTQYYNFRNDDKVYKVHDLSTFKRIFNCSFSNESPANPRFMKAATRQQDGFTINTYKVFTGSSGTYSISLLEAPPVAPQLCETAVIYYRLPKAKGLVYSLKRDGPAKIMSSKGAQMKYDFGQDGDIRPPGIDCISLNEVPYKASDFAYPVGYTLAKSREIYSSKRQKSAADTAIEDLGIGRNLGTQK